MTYRTMVRRLHAAGLIPLSLWLTPEQAKQAEAWDKENQEKALRDG